MQNLGTPSQQCMPFLTLNYPLYSSSSASSWSTLKYRSEYVSFDVATTLRNHQQRSASSYRYAEACATACESSREDADVPKEILEVVLLQMLFREVLYVMSARFGS